MPTRAEHRHATLLKLSDAATALFEAEGPGATIDDIAALAGVSRRTVFRYVESKDELAYIHPVLWFDVFERALVNAPVEPLAERVRVASREIALHIDSNPEPARRAFSVVLRHPELSRGSASIFQRWIDRVALEVLDASPDPDATTTQFRARIVGSAVMGFVDAVTRQWLFSPPEVGFTTLYDEGFSIIAPLFEP